MSLPDDPHYSPEAHAIVAEAILAFVRNEGRPRIQPQDDDAVSEILVP